MKLVLLLAAAVAATPVAEDTAAVAEAGADRDAKLFSVFQIIKFNNDECPALDGSIGSCFTAAECTAKGGKDGGKCASGFGVCCISIVDPNCPPAVIKLSPSLIVNPGFPGNFKADEPCAEEASGSAAKRTQPRIFFPTAATTEATAVTVATDPASITTATPKEYTYQFAKVSDDVVQMKIEFIVFEIAPPDAGDCSNETLTVTGVDTVTSKFLPEKLCGVLTGSHMFVGVKELGADDTLNIVITLTGDREQKWQIRVSQITATSDKLAPRGCLQYYMEDTADVMSFNYNEGNGEVINNLAYSVCLDDTNEAYCSVAVMSMGDFDLTAGTCAGSCTDFISFGGTPNCGSAFTSTTWNQTGRYDMSVFSNEENPTMAVGFGLTLTKLPC